MIIIDGKIYSGNLIFTNGRLIGISLNTPVEKKTFDETKIESSFGIKRIDIDSDVNVKIVACESENIKAHLHGTAITDGLVNLSLTRFGSQIRISVNIKSNNLFSSDVQSLSVENSILTDIDGGLVLEVQIPVTFNGRLYVEGENSNIELLSIFSVCNIEIESKSGNIFFIGSFHNLNIHCLNGIVDIYSEACCDVTLIITCKNGNINVNMNNIKNSELIINSENGITINSPTLNGQYNVSGYITCRNGNVKFY